MLRDKAGNVIKSLNSLICGIVPKQDISGANERFLFGGDVKTLKLKPGEEIQISIIELNWVEEMIRLVSECAKNASGRQLTCYYAFSHLVGIKDTEAVKKANAKFPEYKITTNYFRKWFVNEMSNIFGKWMNENG